MMTTFSPWPSFSSEEAQAVSRTLLSNRVNYWTGEEGRAFEREYAQWTGASHAIAVANGTVALELALWALDIGPGDDVVVTPRTFLASASSIVNAGARPVFADVDPDSQNITTESIARVLTPRTKAVVCVHLAGWPCEMGPILELAGAHGLRVIEDCAQAHGARYGGRMVGTLGDIGAWSFCQDKIMTTGGEGGMITTDVHRLWSRMWSRKDHGKSWEAVYDREHEPGFRWLHESFGTNGRLTEMQACIGRIQLRQMADWTQRRRSNASRIAAACRELDALRVPEVPRHVVHAYYRFYAFVRPERLAAGWNRDRVLHEINAAGVPCLQGSCSEVYLERAFDRTGLRPSERLPVARDLGETSLAFLVHPTLRDDEIDKTCDVVRTVVSRATTG